MNVFSVTQDHMAWLASRQAVAAANLANADTAGFKAKAIAAFNSEMDQAVTRLATTNARHVATPDGEAGGYAIFQKEGKPTLSGNTVVVEEEMRLVGENSRLFGLDAAIAKTFHRMFLASVKA